LLATTWHLDVCYGRQLSYRATTNRKAADPRKSARVEHGLVSNTLTSKEIIARLIELKTVPRQPVSLLSAGAWTLNQSGLTLEQALSVSPERFAQVLAETNERVGCDIVWPGSGFHNLAIRGVGGDIKFRVKGTPDVMEALLHGDCKADKPPTAKVQEDPGVRLLVEAARILARTIGDRTVVGTSQWAPFTLAGFLYGVEDLLRGMRRNPSAVHAVMEYASELCFDYLEPFIEAGVAMISLADPTASGDLISRGQFAEFALPHLRNVAQRIRRRGVWVLVHICGNTTTRLDLIPGSAAQVVSVDYKVQLSRAREILGNKLAFAGNLNPVTVMQKESPDGVAAATRKAIEEARGAAGGYLLMPGCDIPPTVPFENVKNMVETAHAVRT
jgi:uroporphyrinogen decarboxylase